MGYLVVSHIPGQPGVAFDEIVQDLTSRQGWTLAGSAFALAVLTRGRRPPPVEWLVGTGGTGGVLVGRAWDRNAADAGLVRAANLKGLVDLDPAVACRALIEGAWGGYVAVLAGDRRKVPTVLRDPTGAIDALMWRREDVTLVGSELPAGLGAPEGLTIDWDRIGAILADPRRSGGPPPLRGVIGLDPGACWNGQTLEPLWSPGRIVLARRPRPDAEGLRRAVETSVAADAEGAGPIVCEISGGLDSAIVATTLSALGHRPAAAINFYRDQAEGDERLYAQAVADAAGVGLTTSRRAPLIFDDQAFKVAAAAARPSLNALDPEYDRLLIEAVSAAGAEVLFTGHGGDVVFFQLSAPAIGADLLRGQPCEGPRLQRLAQIARRAKRSIWSLAWDALRSSHDATLNRPLDPAGFIRTRARGPAHPWLADLGGVPPGKRVQIAGLVNSLNVIGATGRGLVTRLANPLLSQLVVETCLAVPTPILSAGEADRSFARATFADRLPGIVVERRSKGDIGVFFGRSLAASLDYIRPLLLDGRLVAQGLLDPHKIEAVLSPEGLIWHDVYGELIVALALEAWVRHWEARLSAVDGEASEAGRASASSRNANARA